MFRYLLSSVTFFCCINIIWTNMDCYENCYQKSYVVYRNPTTWIEAFIVCQEAGMEMATIESQHEQDRLEEALDQQMNLRRGIGNGYWVSAGRRTAGAALVWFTNGRPLVYRKFPPGQPDYAGRVENCVEVFIGRDWGYWWNDFNCQRRIGYICQTYTLKSNCNS